MFNEGKKYLAQENYIKKSCKTQKPCPIRGKSIPQFNHGEKKLCTFSGKKTNACTKKFPNHLLKNPMVLPRGGSRGYRKYLMIRSDFSKRVCIDLKKLLEQY